VDDSGRLNLADLRSLQDWYLRYQLQSVPGVAEVASIGGFVRQYQVQVLPNALHAYRLELSDVVKAVRQANGEVGGGLLEFSGTEFMVRAKGYLGSTRDVEQIALGRNPQTGGPLLVKDVALDRQGPELRRGVADLDGRGDAVGGIVVMRYGEDVLTVIGRVKAKLAQLHSSLPPGVRVVTTYDRSDLIHAAKATLQRVPLRLNAASFGTQGASTATVSPITTREPIACQTSRAPSRSDNHVCSTSHLTG